MYLDLNFKFVNCFVIVIYLDKIICIYMFGSYFIEGFVFIFGLVVRNWYKVVGFSYFYYDFIKFCFLLVILDLVRLVLFVVFV